MSAQANPPSYQGIITALTGVVSFFGISSVLYALGFLVFRAHCTQIGIWGGLPLASGDQLVAEGGRFLFNLLYALAAPIVRYPFLLVLPILIALGAETWNCRSGGALAARGRKLRDLLRRILDALPTTMLAVTLFLTAALLQFAWRAIPQPDSLISAAPEAQAAAQAAPKATIDLDQKAKRPQPTNDQKFFWSVWTTAFIVTAGGLAHRRYWSTGDVPRRTLLAAQWVVIAAAVGLLPIAFGRLMVSASYPTFDGPRCPAGACLLLGQTTDTWIIWNRAKRQTEIHPRKSDDPVAIGAKLSMYSP